MSENPFDHEPFRKELGEMFDDKLKPVTLLLEKHDKQLDEHEAALQRARGARWAFHVIWVALVAFGEWFFHSGGKR